MLEISSTVALTPTLQIASGKKHVKDESSLPMHLLRQKLPDTDPHRSSTCAFRAWRFRFDRSVDEYLTELLKLDSGIRLHLLLFHEIPKTAPRVQKEAAND